ncbi:Methyltransf-11 domain-containing protein [Aphelenchoides fujianensis]|nr:Methyltransf-11 domain-containing protein [Aphelenchoides fujianensis]
MRVVGKRYGIEFMNLGYSPTSEEEHEGLFGRIAIEDPALKAHYLLYEKTLSLCPLYPRLNAELLDVGCGLGGGVRLMKRWECKIHGDAEALPFDSSSFDLITNVESSHLYANPQRFFHEAHRVLRAGGHLCWADLREDEKVAEPFAQAERAGFRLVKYERVNDQIVAGLRITAAHYDAQLAKTPFFIRMFTSSLRTTYCAPGTRTFDNFVRNRKHYYVACWQKE